MRKLLVSIARKLGVYQWAVRVDTQRANRRKRRFYKRYGLETLIQAHKAFSSVGAKVFLSFGTLLGAYREGNFIQHDCDLDVGFLYDEKPENMPELLAKYGFKHERQFYLKEGDRIVEDMFSYKGVQIDFFAYFRKGDELYCYIADRHETKTWQEANETDGFPARNAWMPDTGFEEREFLEHRFYMPVKTVEWLKAMYGEGFMTPVKNWDSNKAVTCVKPSKDRVYRKYF